MAGSGGCLLLLVVVMLAWLLVVVVGSVGVYVWIVVVSGSSGLVAGVAGCCL